MLCCHIKEFDKPFHYLIYLLIHLRFCTKCLSLVKYLQSKPFRWTYLESNIFSRAMSFHNFIDFDLTLYGFIPLSLHLQFQSKYLSLTKCSKSEWYYKFIQNWIHDLLSSFRFWKRNFMFMWRKLIWFRFKGCAWVSITDRIPKISSVPLIENST